MFNEGGLKISEFNFEIKNIDKFKEKPNPYNLGFGKFFTDRMFLRKYENGKWDEGIIKKFENFSLSQATSVFHYGQEIFEGLKAFKQKNGDVVIFRIDQNAKRLISSSKRMVIPPISEEYFIESIGDLSNSLSMMNVCSCSRHITTPKKYVTILTCEPIIKAFFSKSPV